jgi:LuxR family maltose regulon positive regulatory protein
MHWMANILPTKFYPPPPPSGFITRPQLLEKLKESLTHRLTLVSAPAGSGKTTLVSAWAQAMCQKEIACGWLSLDDSDNEPGDFLEYLLACLEERGIVIDTAALPFGQGEQSQLEDILADFIRGLMNLKQELVLILDDYHLIQNKNIHTLLEYILRHAPPSLHLVLLTRSDPPLELARMRVTGQLVELRMEHLRFSAQEADAFLKKIAGVQLTEDDVAALNERAEGWIAGLQMAAISMRGREDAAAFVAAFTGSHRYVFDYLLEQVLNRQTPELRGFLLKTSILERLSIPLCDAVTGTSGAARRLLDVLERDNLFLVPLDDERGWYRYHHLFSDLLKLVLEQSHPGLSIELHRRASLWHEAQGMLPQALHHGVLSGDMQLVAQIVSANVLLLVENDEVIPTLKKFDSLPSAEITTLPWLGIARAWILGSSQVQKSLQTLNTVEKSLENVTDNAENQRLKAHIAAARAYVYSIRGDIANTVVYARVADEQLPLDEIAIRALNLTIWGDVLSADQHNPSAMPILEQALSLALQAKKPHVAMIAASALASAHLNAGRIHDAHRVCLEALAIGEDYQKHNQQTLLATASVYPWLARILLEWGDYDKAIQAAQKGLSLSELWGQIDNDVICLDYLGRILLFNNDWEQAQLVFQRAHDTAQKISPWYFQMTTLFILDSLLDSDMPDNEIIQQVRRVQESGAQPSQVLAARLLLREDQPVKALEMLEQALSELDGRPSLDIVRIYGLRALAFQAIGDEKQALVWLRQALELAEPEKRVATFVREGLAMEKLLQLARTKSLTPQFVSRLLAAFESRRKHIPEPAPEIQALIEPLSDRELEILQLLNGPLSTPEIARQLILSANTVRTHIKNIYGKLGVHGRSGAVSRGKELGLVR